jgi:hypothetical protein
MNDEFDRETESRRKKGNPFFVALILFLAASGDLFFGLLINSDGGKVKATDADGKPIVLSRFESHVIDSLRDKRSDVINLERNFSGSWLGNVRQVEPEGRHFSE